MSEKLLKFRRYKKTGAWQVDIGRGWETPEDVQQHQTTRELGFVVGGQLYPSGIIMPEPKSKANIFKQGLNVAKDVITEAIPGGSVEAGKMQASVLKRAAGAVEKIPEGVAFRYPAQAAVNIGAEIMERFYPGGKGFKELSLSALKDALTMPPAETQRRIEEVRLRQKGIAGEYEAKTPEGRESVIGKSIVEGSRQLGPSFTMSAPAYIAQVLPPVIAEVVGGVATGYLAGAPQYDEVIDQQKEKYMIPAMRRYGMSREEAERWIEEMAADEAWKQAFDEGFYEAGSAILYARLFGLAGMLKAKGRPQLFAAMAKNQVLPKILKSFGIVAGEITQENASEVATAIAQTASENRLSRRFEETLQLEKSKPIDPVKAALDVIGPTTWMSLVMTVFGGGANAMANIKRKAKLKGAPTGGTDQRAQLALAEELLGKLGTIAPANLEKTLKEWGISPAEWPAFRVAHQEIWKQKLAAKASEKRASEAEARALTDELTHVMNRRALFQELDKETDPNSWVALADTDDFKKMNDELSHAAGDQALQQLANRISASIRDFNKVEGTNIAFGRYGGDEWGFIRLPQDKAQRFADFITNQVRKRPFTLLGEPVKITISLGYGPRAEGHLAFDNADAALYLAKSEGKDSSRPASDLAKQRRAEIQAKKAEEARQKRIKKERPAAPEAPVAPAAKEEGRDTENRQKPVAGSQREAGQERPQEKHGNIQQPKPGGETVAPGGVFQAPEGKVKPPAPPEAPAPVPVPEPPPQPPAPAGAAAMPAEVAEEGQGVAEGEIEAPGAAVEVVEAPEEAPEETTEAHAPPTYREIPKQIAAFITEGQLRTLAEIGLDQHQDVLARLDHDIAAMKADKENRKRRVDEKVAYLHYFFGGSDWWITEVDRDGTLWGYVVLDNDMQMSEFGAISLDELRSTIIPVGVKLNKGANTARINYGAHIELDFFWTPKTIAECKYEAYPDYFAKPKGLTDQQRAQVEEVEQLAQVEEETRPQTTDDPRPAMLAEDLRAEYKPMSEAAWTMPFKDFCAINDDLNARYTESLERMAEAIARKLQLLKGIKGKDAKAAVKDEIEAARQMMRDLSERMNQLSVEDGQKLREVWRDRLANDGMIVELDNMDDLLENINPNNPRTRERNWDKSLEDIYQETLEYLRSEDQKDAMDAKEQVIEEAVGELPEPTEEAPTEPDMPTPAEAEAEVQAAEAEEAKAEKRRLLTWDELMSLEKVSNDFYVMGRDKSAENGGYIKAKNAKPWHSFGGIDLFTYYSDGHYPNLDKGWWIVEARSGLGACRRETRNDAIHAWRAKEDNLGVANIRSIILGKIQEYGLSPRYSEGKIYETAGPEQGEAEAGGPAPLAGPPTETLPGTTGKRGVRKRPGRGGGEPAGGRGGVSPQGEGPGGQRGTGGGPGAGSAETGLPAAKPEGLGGRRYQLTDDDIAFISGGNSFKPKERAQANLEAIRLLKKLETEDREATVAEKSVLARYCGWGGLAQDVFAYDRFDMMDELRELLTPQEIAAAKASTLNAHYTSPEVVKAVWAAVQQLGFHGGRIIEPSMGVGNFFGLMPEELSQIKLLGVELDSITGRIAAKIYGNVADIRVSGYEKLNLNDNSLDLAISNVPFGQFKLQDKYDMSLNALRLNIHNFFFAKTLKKVRPGGLVAFITSRYTMDSKDGSFREYLAQQADLVAAFRLPGTAFAANAGTDVVSDILILKKLDENVSRTAEDAKNLPWVQVKEVELPHEDNPKNKYEVSVNRYFLDNKGHVMGQLQTGRGMHSYNDLKVNAEDGWIGDLQARIAELPDYIYSPALAMPTGEIVNAAEEHPEVKQGSYMLKDNKVYQKQGADLVEQKILHKDDKARIAAMIELQKQLHETIKAESESADDTAVKPQKDRLNKLYDAFVAKYGRVNSRTNKKAFGADPEYSVLQSLEYNYDRETGTADKADIFTKRVYYPAKVISKVENSKEALIASLNMKGKLDLDYMAQISGKTAEQLVEDLKGLIYKDPEGDYILADQYLTGDVKGKLETAREMAKADKRYLENVKALERVQPAPIPFNEIGVNLGSPWVPRSVIADFIREGLNINVGITEDDISYSDILGRWVIEKSAYRWQLERNPGNTINYGTRYIGAGAVDIVQSLMNHKNPTITKTENGKQVVDGPATEAARAKAEMIKDRWQTWVWDNRERRNMLTDLYNEKYNRIVVRNWDGSHLELPGLNVNFHPRPFQRDAIWRIINTGRCLLAHCVGAGKTATMIISAHEMKRMGLIRKPLFVVKGNTVGQYETELRRLYPGGKYLVLNPEDLDNESRKESLARIATGDWDAIVMSHDTFKRIYVSEKQARKNLENMLAELDDQIAELEDNQKISRKVQISTIKQMEARKQIIIDRFEQIYAKKASDLGVAWEELGIDQLYVDESDTFKNMFVRHNMAGIAGVPVSGGSQFSWDLQMKIDLLYEKQNGRGVVFATGTPISNTMAELYILQRYLQPDELKAYKVSAFDSWAHNFGDVVNKVELAPEGGDRYRVKPRFVKFFNVAELLRIYREMADVVDKKTANLPMPKIAGGKPQTIVTQPSTLQVEYIKTLGVRADMVRSGKVEPSVDNMLKITMDGRKCGTDMRLIDPRAIDHPNSKVNVCARKVAEIYKATAEKKLTQVIFLDLSTPQKGQWSLYEDIRRKLQTLGIPREQVAFAHEAPTKAKTQKLYADINAGRVRVVIGSTEKLGAGANICNKLVALHHLDAASAMRPRDIEQREGRIVRQGNTNDEIQIYRYVCEKTFDAYIWQLMENKAGFAGVAMSPEISVRSMEDVERDALNYAEVKALATGNPRIMEKARLDMEVQRYRRLFTNYIVQRAANEDAMAKVPAEIRIAKETIANLQSILTAAKNLPEKFAINTWDGQALAERKKVGEYILEQNTKKLEAASWGPTPLGIYGDFKLEQAVGNNGRPQIIIREASKPGNVIMVEGSLDPVGTTMAITNSLKPELLEKQITFQQNALKTLEEQLQGAKEAVEKPFEYEAVMKDAVAKLAKVNQELGVEKAEAQHDYAGTLAGSEDARQGAGGFGRPRKQQETEEAQSVEETEAEEEAEAPAVEKTATMEDVAVPGEFTELLEKMRVDKRNYDTIFEAVRGSGDLEATQQMLADAHNIDISMDDLRRLDILLKGGAGAVRESRFVVDLSLTSKLLEDLAESDPAAAQHLEEGLPRLGREAPAEAQEFLRWAEAKVMGRYKGGRGGREVVNPLGETRYNVQTHNMTQALADNFHITPDYLKQIPDDVAQKLPAEMAAVAVYRNTMATQMQRMAAIFTDENTDQATRERILAWFEAMGPSFLDAAVKYKLLETAGGRMVEFTKTQKHDKAAAVLHATMNALHAENLDKMDRKKAMAIIRRLAEVQPDPNNPGGYGDSLNAAIEPLIKPGFWQAINEWQKAIKLWNPGTMLVNIGSNFMNYLWSGGLEKGLAVFADVMGEKVLSKDRTTYAGELGAARLGMGLGLLKGTQEGLEALLYDLPGRAQETEHIHAPALPGKFGYVVRTPFRVLNASDRAMMWVNIYTILSQDAYAKYYKRGLRGEKLKDAIRAAIQAPMEDELRQAKRKAEEWLYREKLDPFNSLIEQALQSAPLLQTIVPFFRTPVNVTKWAWRRTPILGLASRNITDIRRGGRAAREAVARQISGGMITLAVIVMFEAGLLIGPAPEDRDRRLAFYRAGKLPWSIYIPGYGYFSVGRWEPFTTHIKIISSALQAAKDLRKKRSRALMGKAISMIMDSLLDQTYVLGVNQMLEAVNDPGRYGERFLQNWLIGMTIPTGMGYLARLTDPTFRRTKTLMENVGSRLPGISYLVPPKLGSYGEEQKRPGFGSRLQPIVVFSKQADLDRVDQELERLEQPVRGPGWRYSLAGQPQLLTADEYDWLLKEAGPEIKRQLAYVMFQQKDETTGRLAYQAMDDDARRAVISNLVRNIRLGKLTQLKQNKLGGAKP